MTNEKDQLLRHYSQPILQYLDDPGVTDICIPQWNKVTVERNGVLEDTDASWPTEFDFVSWIKQVARSLGQDVHEQKQPIVDARLPDGTRFNATLAPTSVLGPNAVLRPYPKKLYTLQDLMDKGALNSLMMTILQHAVAARLNIVISGGTGSGKTTALRGMCQFIPHAERVLVVEDTTEDLLPNHPHKVYNEAPKRKTGEDTPVVTMGGLIANTLRGRPDRVIVGEIRTPEAASALVDAINTGHGGTQSTIHANSDMDTLFRLEILYARQALNMGMELVQAIVRRNVDLIVHATKMIDGDRRIRVLRQILWLDDTNPVRLVEYRKGRGFVEDEAAIRRFFEMTAH